MKSTAQQQILRQSLLLLSVDRVAANVYTAKLLLSLNEVAEIDSYLITPKKDEYFLCVKELGGSYIHRIKRTGPKKTTICNIHLHPIPPKLSELGNRQIDTGVLRNSCIWIPENLLLISHRTLVACAKMRRIAGLTNTQDCLWWPAFQIASLSEAYRLGDKRKEKT